MNVHMIMLIAVMAGTDPPANCEPFPTVQPQCIAHEMVPLWLCQMIAEEIRQGRTVEADTPLRKGLPIVGAVCACIEECKEQ